MSIRSFVRSFVCCDGTSESGQVLNDDEDITSLFCSLAQNVNNDDFLMPNGNGRIPDRIFLLKKLFSASIGTIDYSFVHRF